MVKKVKKAPEGQMNKEEIKAFILECDRDFDARLLSEIEKLKADNIKVIRLTGPTCSGKSTATKKIVAELQKSGRKVHSISVDDFYYDRETLHAMAAEEGDGEIDYDSVKTIDLSALSEFVKTMSKGGILKCPIFDFKEGGRTGYRDISAGADDVFLFEGIQVIYPEIRALFADYACADFYIEPLCEIAVGDYLFSKNEIRFLRRVVRDRHFRNTSPEFTFQIWKSVRANEDKNIFPYIDGCGYYIESSFAYEIGVLKPYLEEYFKEIDKDSEYRGEADEILKHVAPATEIPEELIPKDSLYREFV